MKTATGEMDPSLEEIHGLALHRINQEKDMRQGIEADDFEMHYQPIVRLDSGLIAGFEALMRWRKNDGGYVSPVEFIPLAEDTGLIIELGRWALQVGLRDQRRFADFMPEVVVIQHSRFQKPLTSADPLMNLLLRVVLVRSPSPNAVRRRSSTSRRISRLRRAPR